MVVSLWHLKGRRWHKHTDTQTHGHTHTHSRTSRLKDWIGLGADSVKAIWKGGTMGHCTGGVWRWPMFGPKMIPIQTLPVRMTCCTSWWVLAGWPGSSACAATCTYPGGRPTPGRRPWRRGSPSSWRWSRWRWCIRMGVKMMTDVKLPDEMSLHHRSWGLFHLGERTNHFETEIETSVWVCQELGNLDHFF